MQRQILKYAWNSTLLILFVAALIDFRQPGLFGQELISTQKKIFLSGRQVIILLDINPHQKKVLAVELALAEGVIQRLNQPGNAFTMITFGSNPPTLIKSNVTADEALASVREITLEPTRDKYFFVHFYDALDLAFSHFTDDERSKTLLTISEGDDYFPHTTFKETIQRAEQLRAACDVALVANHTFYGTKGIQRYGFYLRRLAGRTHGQYVEVGGQEKKVPRSVERIFEGIVTRTARPSGRRIGNSTRLIRTC